MASKTPPQLDSIKFSNGIVGDNKLCLVQLHHSSQRDDIVVSQANCFGTKFNSIKNDFNLADALAADALEANLHRPNDESGQFPNHTHLNQAKQKKVKRFRFVVCTLALVALALSVMSRSLFNISIVDMTKDEAASEASLSDNITDFISSSQQIPQVVKTIRLSEDPANPTPEIVSVFTVNEIDDENPERESAGLHFSWSVKATNFLLSAFFIGYAPSMFFSGGIAEQYGSMFLLSVCVVGSALINAFTPFMAAFSYYSLMVSRIALGILQGPLVPACYDLFNKWLTITEMSVFVPLVKVSMAMGTLAGTVLPGFVELSGHDWTYNFYIGSLVCLVWSILWFPLASSEPQTNKRIDDNELKRIMRKKSIPSVAVIKLNNVKNKSSSIQEKGNSPTVIKVEPATTTSSSIPWISIIASPSVLVLTFVKFTYNLGMDFMFIMSAIYLKEIHGASTETVSLIAGTGCGMQMLLITFVGSLATYLVRNQTFGLSRTIWRKIFQGSSNLAMAFIFYLIPQIGPDQFSLVAGLFIMVYFFWMFGVGGESMIPYDLSPKYPATIMGFAHSLSILSGFVLPSVCSLVLGDDKKNPARWNVLFLLISGALALGGLAFVSIIKAKPFLASERAKYDESALKEKSLRNGYSKRQQEA